MKAKPTRTQSPSSINTYKQCPRKYYYLYIERIPTKPSIHLVRGSVVHEVLENFFNAPPLVSNSYENELKVIALKLFEKYWNDNKEKLDKLKMKESELKHYHQESQLMIINWLNQFIKRLKEDIEKTNSFYQSFTNLTPEREIKYTSVENGVMGYIDAIEKENGQITIIDYKTSKNAKISPEYRLQLAIYAMMYKEKHGIIPQKLGIDFLKHHRIVIDGTEELVQDALFEIEQIHMLTQTRDIIDYPKKTSPLCKWSTGQCDYYDYCFKKKQIKKE